MAVYKSGGKKRSSKKLKKSTGKKKLFDFWIFKKKWGYTKVGVKKNHQKSCKVGVKKKTGSKNKRNSS